MFLQNLSSSRSQTYILLRTEGAYVVYPRFTPCPNASIEMEFISLDASGLLLYSEDVITGRFISLSLLSNFRVKLEMELRLPQYRMTRDHLTLVFSIAFTKGSVEHNGSNIWNTLALKILPGTNRYFIGGLELTVNGKSIMKSFPMEIMYHHVSQPLIPETKFGDVVYIGNVPERMKADASERALFTVAMQPSMQTILRNFRFRDCSSKWQNFELSELKFQCTDIPMFVGNSATFRIPISMKKATATCDGTVSRIELNSEKYNYTFGHDCFMSEYISMSGREWATVIFPSDRKIRKTSLEFRTRDQDQILCTIHLKSTQLNRFGESMESGLAVCFVNGKLDVSFDNKHLEHTHSSNSDLLCISDYDTCADTQWHLVEFILEKNYFSVILDGQTPVKYKLTNNLIEFTIHKMHLGKPLSTGSSGHFGISLHLLKQPFRGCLRKVTFQEAEFQFELNSKFHESFNFQSSSNLFTKDCDYASLLSIKAVASQLNGENANIPNVVTFNGNGSYMRIRGWSVTAKSQLSFKFRTNVMNALLVFSSSIDEDKLTEGLYGGLVIPGSQTAGFDTLAIELRGGNLVAIVNSGAGATQLRYHADSALSDNEWHMVFLGFEQGNIILRVDHNETVSHMARNDMYKFLNLNGLIYLGGLPETIRRISSIIAPEVWSAHLNQNFLGCLGDVIVDAIPWDVNLELRPCWTRHEITTRCSSSISSLTCTDAYCQNKGLCLSQWQQFKCDCSQSNFRGERCNVDPLILNFNGFQLLTVLLHHFPFESSAENMLIRFRTKQRSQALIFTTRDSRFAASDCLELQINNGQAVLIYDFGEGRRKYKSFVYVADNEWHSVQVIRKSQMLNFTVDGIQSNNDVKQDGRFLSMNRITLGSNFQNADNQVSGLKIQNEYIKNSRYFIGQISKFEFNGRDVLARLQSIDHNHSRFDWWRQHAEITATVSDAEKPTIEFPVQFFNTDSHITFMIPKESTQFIIEFYAKFTKNIGTLLMYCLDKTEVFKIIFMNGSWQVLYYEHVDKQSQMALSIGLNAVMKSHWHFIQIFKGTIIKGLVEIFVDGERTSFQVMDQFLFENQSITFGSYTQNFNYADIPHDSTFHGCLASVLISFTDVNREPRSRENNRSKRFGFDPRSSWIWNNIRSGCDPQQFIDREQHDQNCSPRLCQFNGRCVQQLLTARCDCTLTSFGGKFCSETGDALQLPASTISFVSFEIFPPQNTTRDEIAFGIQTTSTIEQMGIIFVGNREALSDFIEIAMIPVKNILCVMVRFNLGGGVRTLYEPGVDVADGRYHVVQFIRDGKHATLMVDFRFKQETTSRGKFGAHFNDVNFILIGSKNVSNATNFADPMFTSKPLFHTKPGTLLAGLFFNGIDLLSVLKGLLIPGIFITSHVNAQIIPNPHFNVDHLSEHLYGSETNRHRTVNDMQNQQAGDNLKEVADLPTQPLIVPRIRCPDPQSLEQLKTCRPSDEQMLVKPVIHIKQSLQQQMNNEWNWNADQSKSRQSRPTDYTPMQTASRQVGMDSHEKFTAYKNNTILTMGPRNIEKPSLTSFTGTGTESLNKKLDFKAGLDTNFMPGKTLGFNIGLIVSVSTAGVCLIIVLTCVIYRLMRRDEGSYDAGQGHTYNGEDAHPCEVQRCLPQKIKCESNKIIDINKSSELGQENLMARSGKSNDQNSTCDILISMQEIRNSPSVSIAGPQKRRSQLIRIDSPAKQIESALQRTKNTKTSNASPHEWFL